MTIRLRPRFALMALMLGMVDVNSMHAQQGASDSARAARRTDDEHGRIDLPLGDDMRVSLGGYLQVDGRWAAGPQSRAPDGLLLRRARLVFDASRPDGWHVRLQPDFGQGRVLVQDAFVGWRGSRSVVRVGRFRPAFGTERMQSSSTLLFPERSIVNTLMPSRSMGAQFTREQGRLGLAFGAFRTPIGTDVQVVDTDGDVGAAAGVGYDLLARVGWRVVQRARYVDAQVSLLAGSEVGTDDTPAVARVLSVGQLPLAAVRADQGRTAVADGARRRWSVGAVAGTSRLMLGMEAAHLSQEVRVPSVRTPLRTTALSLRSAYVVGGTRTASQEITPRTGRGAVELGVRAGRIAVQTRERQSVLADGSIRHAHTAGTALSWIPTVSTRLSVALDVTTPSFAGLTERVAVMRWQQAF